MRDSLERKGSTANDIIHLKRRVGLFSGVALIVGTMIGSGIFVSPSGLLIRTGSVGVSFIIWMACGCLSLLGKSIDLFSRLYVYLYSITSKAHVATVVVYINIGLPISKLSIYSILLCFILFRENKHNSKRTRHCVMEFISNKRYRNVKLEFNSAQHFPISHSNGFLVINKNIIKLLRK